MVLVYIYKYIKDKYKFELICLYHITCTVRLLIYMMTRVSGSTYYVLLTIIHLVSNDKNDNNNIHKKNYCL